MAVRFTKNTSNVKLNVFIIDDSPLVCDNLKDLIIELGRNAAYETDPETALQVFERNIPEQDDKFDVCIVDQRMPKLEGLAVIDEIQKMDNSMEIIMLTVEGKNEELEDRALKLGIRAFIDKADPQRTDHIIHAIMPIFNKKKKIL